MSLDTRHLFVLCTFGLAACNGPSPEPAGGATAPPTAAVSRSSAQVTAHDFDVGEIKTEEEYLAEAPYSEADLRRGEVLSLACRVCHTLGEGQEHRDGPNLHGMFGSRAGSREGFAYSDALSAVDLVWTPRALDAWLVQPSTFIPDNTMVFAGLRSESDRRDVLAYLLRETAPKRE